MDPAEYCKLLFDDESFSRSRLYFWIIGFVMEVQPSIDDNITQWSLYQRARIQPLLEDLVSKGAPGLNNTADLGRSTIDILKQYLEEGNQIMQDLENLKERFDAIAMSVQALRDGVRLMRSFIDTLWFLTWFLLQLFNASALMESRSATKLGQDVQLLTYVSIFYLPLGFCAVSLFPHSNTCDYTNCFYRLSGRSQTLTEATLGPHSWLPQSLSLCSRLRVSSIWATYQRPLATHTLHGGEGFCRRWRKIQTQSGRRSGRHLTSFRLATNEKFRRSGG